jgi:hypothetical protein
MGTFIQEVLDFPSKVSDRYLCFSRLGSPSLHLATVIESNDSSNSMSVDSPANKAYKNTYPAMLNGRKE